MSADQSPTTLLSEAPIIDADEPHTEDIGALSLPSPIAPTDTLPPSSTPSIHTFTLLTAAPSTTTTVTPDVLKAFNLHNAARKAKGIPALAYDKNLETGARQWAQNLANNIHSLQHSTSQQRPNQGENLYWASGGGAVNSPCASGTQAWLDEARFYTGQKTGESAKGVIGHYSESFSFFF